MDGFEKSADILIVAFMLGWTVGALVAQARRSNSIVQALTFSVGKAIAAGIALAYLAAGIFWLRGFGVVGWAAIGVIAGLVFAYMRHWPLTSSTIEPDKK